MSIPPRTPTSAAYLNDGQLPPKDAVRIEELVNYFEYDYPQPAGDVPFSVTTEIAVCPWNPTTRSCRSACRAKKIALDNTPPSNLVFLIDVSGSMNSPDKLPLLKDCDADPGQPAHSPDRVAMVVYAGASGLVLPSTPVGNKGEILNALTGLNAGGSTNGGQGIQLAYQVANENFIRAETTA